MLVNIFRSFKIEYFQSPAVNVKFHTLILRKWCTRKCLDLTLAIMIRIYSGLKRKLEILMKTAIFDQIYEQIGPKFKKTGNTNHAKLSRKN